MKIFVQFSLGVEKLLREKGFLFVVTKFIATEG